MILKIIKIALLSMVSIAGFTQSVSKQFAATITQEGLRKHLSYLTSDNLEGRETSRPGQYLAARYLASQFKEIGLDPIVPLASEKSYFQWFDVYRNGKSIKLSSDLEQQPDGYENAASMNVLGYLEGSSLKEEIIVYSAHYDHIGISSDGQINNGADDDGSGTSSLLEIAEAFAEAKEDGHGPKRSILFIFFSGEEKGLLGSKYFTNYEPVVALDRIVCDLNIDMIGRKDELHETDQYLYLIGADKLSTELDKISRKMNKKHLRFDIDYTYNDENDPNRFYYRSDHYNFAKNNIPVIFFFTGVHEDYHKPTDDIEKILFPKYKAITQYAFYIGWQVANQKKRLRLNEH